MFVSKFQLYVYNVTRWAWSNSGCGQSFAHMQFVVESVSAHGARVGELLVNGGLCGALETPLCLLYTRSGAVPHLTGDALAGT